MKTTTNELTGNTFFKTIYQFYIPAIVFVDMIDNTYNSWFEMLGYRFGNLYYFCPKEQESRQFHPFHILSISPWPFFTSLSILSTVSGIIDFLTATPGWSNTLIFGLAVLSYCVGSWWSDVIEESLTEHNQTIKTGIGIGMILFIISEVMFFFSFFWAFFHVSLAPSIEIGCVWPPKGLEHLVISPFGAPLLNTIILVVSGLTVTCFHHAFNWYCNGNFRVLNYYTQFQYQIFFEEAVGFINLLDFRKRLYNINRYTALAELLYVGFSRRVKNVSTSLMLEYNQLEKPFSSIFGFYGAFGYAVWYGFITLILAIFFTISQAIEYLHSSICISDGVYGSTFFVMTGFHGFHVIVGTIFLAISFFRFILHKFSFVRFIGLECAIWYWHFVDVVWLFLYLFVYIWGNGLVSNVTLESLVSFDVAITWQLGFQDSASVLMEGIVDLHNYIMFYLLLILGLVFWLLAALLLSQTKTFYPFFVDHLEKLKSLINDFFLMLFKL